eukprot:CAMPEP_0198262432 /NCGR_PEP_ID=MMETSP1447-20131203/10937_1 /TAXON_ID=420782 /ORGANISM="Chaetoceros dichaeta, Strain CCMP1751" /LENGTH=52 /DNA_ID=CAMNT_0043950663 /DNA_START=285 /DNA_END=443 /DNA_ORIENTATION=-
MAVGGVVGFRCESGRKLGWGWMTMKFCVEEETVLLPGRRMVLRVLLHTRLII